MLTKELITNIAQKTGLSKRRCEELLSATTAAIADEIRLGNSLQLQGLGVLEIKHTSERQMVHPKTGERSIVPAGAKLNFKPAETLKEQCNPNV